MKKAKQALAQSGMLPHQFLLSVVRGARHVVYEMDEAGHIRATVCRPAMAERISVAKSLAPYFAAPRTPTPR